MTTVGLTVSQSKVSVALKGCSIYPSDHLCLALWLTPILLWLSPHCLYHMPTVALSVSQRGGDDGFGEIELNDPHEHVW